MPGQVPTFGFDEVDRNPNSVSLSTRPNKEGDNFWNSYFAAGAQAAPHAPVGLNLGNQDAARTWQQQLMQDLHRQAAGDPNSRAQQSLAGAYTQARAGQSALGSSIRGTGGGAGLRHGVMGAGNVQRSFAGDSQMLMQQEQQAAQALLAQQLAAQRQQDAQQAAMTAQNAQQNQSLEDAMRQFYTGGGINAGLAQLQTAGDRARVTLGFDLENQDLQGQLYNRMAGAAGTAGATAARFYGAGQGGSGFRQVDGQNSIVPEWDK